MPSLHMQTLLRLAVLGVALALPGAALAQSVDAVSASSPRVLADGVMTLKGDDGVRVTQRSTMTYDPVAGEYVREVTDADTGRLLERTVLRSTMVRPTPAEDAMAQEIIRADPEVAALIAAARHEVRVEGGFPLVREAGHGCGTGSRCFQYDVYELVPGQLAAERLRYVVVDLRSLSMFSNDFDVVNEGNRSDAVIAR